MVINLIQDIATPHNNVLISEIIKNNGIHLNLWYSIDKNEKMYQWDNNLTDQFCKANIYGTKINFKFLLYCLKNKNQKYILVGWMNINTKLLHFLFFLIRRPFIHWTDLPNPSPENHFFLKEKVKKISYKLLKNSNCKVFVVGRPTIKYFENLKFTKSRIINLPIFVKTNDDFSLLRSKKNQIKKKYVIDDNCFIISAGSRLIYEKGYDLLIKALALIPESSRRQMKLIIVGSGSYKEQLLDLIEKLNLKNYIIIEPWLDIEDFKALIFNSDIFIHPARFDSYGGTILSMALGTPVIGSMGAGAALDRIEHGVNGFLYESNDINTLARYIQQLFIDEDLKIKFSLNSLTTAKFWSPQKGVEIILNNI